MIAPTSTVGVIMWICFNDAFVSIVRKEAPPGHLLVRARRVEHLEALFPNLPIAESDGTDYRFRVFVPELELARLVTSRLLALDYSNFKDSVRDNALHAAYHRVWSEMARLQPYPPYSTAASRRARRRKDDPAAMSFLRGLQGEL